MNLSWDMVRELNSSKVITTTSIWVFIVPILVKAMRSNMLFLDTLPVTLGILYLSGVSFFLGALVYVFFAPKIVKQNDDFSSFVDKGGNTFLLQTYLGKLNIEESAALKADLITLVGEPSAEDINNGAVNCIEIGKHQDVYNFESDKLKDVFWLVYDYYLKKGPCFILASLFFHFLGFLGLAYMFICNFLVVVKGM